MLTSDALRHSARATHDRLGGPGQWLLALPVTHVAGLTVLVRSLQARTRPEVLDLYGGFSVEAFVAATGRLHPDVRRYTSLVPTQLRRLLDAGADLSTYDGVLVGGAALSPSLQAAAVDAGVSVVTTYGMSETCGGCVYDGEPLDGVTVQLRDDGRVELGGPVVFAGYRLRPDLTAEALVGGRHLTQDLGRWLPDGRLEVVGRADDVVLTGGVTVPAAMVERVLGGHPARRGVRRGRSAGPRVGRTGGRGGAADRLVRAAGRRVAARLRGRRAGAGRAARVRWCCSGCCRCWPRASRTRWRCVRSCATVPDLHPEDLPDGHACPVARGRPSAHAARRCRTRGRRHRGGCRRRRLPPRTGPARASGGGHAAGRGQLRQRLQRRGSRHRRRPRRTAAPGRVRTRPPPVR